MQFCSTLSALSSDLSASDFDLHCESAGTVRWNEKAIRKTVKSGNMKQVAQMLGSDPEAASTALAGGHTPLHLAAKFHGGADPKTEAIIKLIW